jgi:hypothetical protein
LEETRSILKDLYETLDPFLRKLRRAKKLNTPASQQILTILRQNNIDEPDITKRFDKSNLKAVNKEIYAMIQLEIEHGKMLPYGKLLLGIYAKKPSPYIKIAQRILPRACQNLDFKITYRALHFLHSTVTRELPHFSNTFHFLYQRGIHVIETPDHKWELKRRAFKTGDEFYLGNKNKETIRLGVRLGAERPGWDGRIIFRVNPSAACSSSWTTTPQIIIFYPNRCYRNHLIHRDRRDTVGIVAQNSFVNEEHKMRWSVEDYLEPRPLQLSDFLSIVKFFIEKDYLVKVDFSEVRYHGSQQRFFATKPIYKMEPPNYFAFLESLIDYFPNYQDDYFSLFQYLTECLHSIDPKYTIFFRQLVSDVLEIPIDNCQEDMNNLAGSILARRKQIAPDLNSKNPHTELFLERCTKMVKDLYDARKTLIEEINTSSRTIEEAKERTDQLLFTLKNHLPQRVCSWIIPSIPEFLKSLKISEKSYSSPYGRGIAMASTSKMS